MSPTPADFWTESTSVLFTSFWGWSPESWGTVGWTGDRGLARRTNLLKGLSDPFITVCYVTSNQTFTDPDLKGMIAGFYLVSHETGDRDEFTHPSHHNRSPEKWRHSLRALRAFNYLPEYRLSVTDYDPLALDRARTIAAMGELVTDPKRIALLRDTPWVEVDVYTPPKGTGGVPDDDAAPSGFVKAGPASSQGYEVSNGTAHLERLLYVLKLAGDTSAYLGRASDGRAIFKIGISVSPDTRRQQLQKVMPKGAFQWQVSRTSANADSLGQFGFEAAVAGEYAMKQHLAEHAEHLNGEFYLATTEQIDAAWERGLATAQAHGLEASQ